MMRIKSTKNIRRLKKMINFYKFILWNNLYFLGMKIFQINIIKLYII